MDGIQNDSLYKDSTFGIVDLKNIFKGDAFQRFAYFVEAMSDSIDALISMKRSRHHHAYDTRLKELFEHAALVWCDFVVRDDHIRFNYNKAQVCVFDDHASFRTPSIEITLTHKEFTRWAARYLDFKVSA